MALVQTEMAMIHFPTCYNINNNNNEPKNPSRNTLARDYHRIQIFVIQNCAAAAAADDKQNFSADNIVFLKIEIRR